MPKILYVCHNHPAIRPGGAEIYAHELYKAVRDDGRFEPFFVGRTTPSQATHDGTRFGLVGEDPNDYYLFTERDEFDRLMWSARNKQLYTRDWREFLRAVNPDIVHFQHTAWVGYDVIRETRSTLPDAPILYTLHEFVPICHHNGQMVRTNTLELCYSASPQRCHQCFPRIPADTFFLRERFAKSAFDLVDLFIAPSEQLRQRYIEWGIPPAKIRYEDYGRLPVTPIPDPPDAGRRKRVGFFGRITEFKGAHLMLEAMSILDRERSGIQLLLRGATLEIQPEHFRARMTVLFEHASSSVHYGGRYDHEQLPALLSAVDWAVVPSIWWENSPLVIQEAMAHRRPVICSNIGGMAETVEDGVTGLHFSVGDPYSLAETIRRGAGDPELWDTLRAQITGPHPMDQHLDTLADMYLELLDRTHAPTARKRSLNTSSRG
jgi:glycosyltransferase involved in cell wall biosynthesis